MRNLRMNRAGPAAAVLALIAALGAAPALAQPPAALPPQTSNVQAVAVSVTPRALSANTDPWEFEITFNTHSQTLDDDLKKGASLVDAAGRHHAPLAWNGDAAGGHHRKGVLVFAPLAPMPSSIELQIQRTGEPEPRSFRWALQ